jgi:AraC-like DNA-binding protein
VGYGSASAFTRAFIRKTGKAPTHWLRNVEADAAPQA